MIAYLLVTLTLTAAVLLHPRTPAQGVHRAGAPARPAPAQGRREGPVKPGWGELRPIPAGRHESGAYPIIREAAA